MTDLGKVITQFKDKKVLVVGDLMLDQYTHGDVRRISPEAPIPVLTKVAETFVPGGSANVANNLAALGSRTVLSGVVGKDENQEQLLGLLKFADVDTSLVMPLEGRPTTLKRRFVTNGNQQLLRLDDEVVTPITNAEEQKLFFNIKKRFSDFDVIILSDYAKGVFSGNLAQLLIKLAKKNRKLIIGDVKPRNKDKFKGIDFIAPNLNEAFEMAGVVDLSEAGKILIRYFRSNILVTKGAEGISIFPKGGKRKDIPTKKIKVYDVSGAGDTLVAALSLALACGASFEDAAVISNTAAGIVVQKPGTSTVSLEELRASLAEEHHIDSVAIVPKLWGYEKWLENNEKYCSKILSLNKGYQCSLHYHKIKDEMFIILKGHVRLEIGEKVLHMREGHYVRLEPGTIHRFRGIEDSEILEVSTHHMEEDSYRLEESRKVEGDNMIQENGH